MMDPIIWMMMAGIALLTPSIPEGASSWDSGGLPLEMAPEVKGLLTDGELAAWFEALQSQDPCLKLDDFRFEREVRMFTYVANALRDSLMENKVTFGVLIPSPDETFVLDPMAGIDVQSDGSMRDDTEVGFQVMDAVSGDQIMGQIYGNTDIFQATWLDPRTFVVVGCTHGWRMGLELYTLPTVWVGDLDQFLLWSYTGRPIIGDAWNRAYQLMMAKKMASYPGLRWN